MGDTKPETTEKIVLPKNLQREMIKFFAQARRKNISNATENKEKQQTPEILKKGALIYDKHRSICTGFDRGTGKGRLLHPGAGRKAA
jgi:hypothetical protein